MKAYGIRGGSPPLAFAHNSNLRIVAEGVESNDQFEFFISKEVRRSPGDLHFISPLVEADGFTALLEESQSKQVLALAQEASG